MWTNKSFYIEAFFFTFLTPDKWVQLTLICFLSFIHWPEPKLFKITCSRESARIVRKIIQTRWQPILDKYKVNVPLECPFHPRRDVFHPQQAAKKQNRPRQWTCGFCGKSFYEEKHLDQHFEHRHKTKINMAEDAICLADYCDIMRCKVLLAKDSTLAFGGVDVSTDLEVWNEAAAFRTMIELSTEKSIGTVTGKSLLLFNEKDGRKEDKKICKEDSSEEEEEDNIVTETDETDEGNISTCDSLPMNSKAHREKNRIESDLSDIQTLKANCKTNDLEPLKIRCELLIHDCVAGLIIQLTDEQFKNMEGELNRAICWYLTCDKYWEDGATEHRDFPWALVAILILVLSSGISFCYYIIWILFESDDHNSIGNNIDHYSKEGGRGTLINYHENVNPAYLQVQVQPQPNSTFGDELYAAPEFPDVGQSDHYIYVTYPPELKRRLLESCYNRTTRL